MRFPLSFFAYGVAGFSVLHLAAQVVAGEPWTTMVPTVALGAVACWVGGYVKGIQV